MNHSEIRLVTRKSPSVKKAYELVGNKYFIGSIDKLELHDPTHVDRQYSGNLCYQNGKEFVFGVRPTPIQSVSNNNPYQDYYLFEGSLGNTYCFPIEGDIALCEPIALIQNTPKVKPVNIPLFFEWVNQVLKVTCGDLWDIAFLHFPEKAINGRLTTYQPTILRDCIAAVANRGIIKDTLLSSYITKQIIKTEQWITDQEKSVESLNVPLVLATIQASVALIVYDIHKTVTKDVFNVTLDTDLKAAILCHYTAKFLHQNDHYALMF